MTYIWTNMFWWWFIFYSQTNLKHSIHDNFRYDKETELCVQLQINEKIRVSQDTNVTAANADRGQHCKSVT